MSKHFKRAVSVLLSALLLAGILTVAPLSVSAESNPYTADGTCGYPNSADIHWYAFNDRTMVFLGTGDMQDYTRGADGNSTAPWFNINDPSVFSTIISTKIVVESGITTIGDYAFCISPVIESALKNYRTVGTIDLADTVTSIGTYAFENQVFENIVLPPSVTYIGTKAFYGCKNLQKINYFGNPDELRWDHVDGDEFSNTSYTTPGRKMDCHILNTYSSDDVARFNAKFSAIGLHFQNDLVNPYTNVDGYTRNIALYYGATNSNIFAGAYPYIIVGTFDGKKKSTTYGSNGFVSCVRIPDGNGGFDYYALSDSSGTLKKVKIENGRATKLEGTYTGLTLKLEHQYIGSNVVKVIYKLKNNTGTDLANIRLGGSGDIKIGADDRADINPLKNDQNSKVGFYMTSGQAYDLGANGEHATLGFIGSNIRIGQDDSVVYPAATWFYGTVGGSPAYSAAGTRGSMLIPERIFDKNTSGEQDGVYKSYPQQTEDDPPQVIDTYALKRDSGMSFYWNIASLPSDNTEHEYAVLFSIYGNNSDGKEMVNDITATYHTVIFKNGETELQKILVKEGTTQKPVYPVYTGETPKKERDSQNKYIFSGWSPAITAVTQDSPDEITYTAQFNPEPLPFFTGHSLTLNGDIGVNFYVDPTTIENVTVKQDHSLSKTVELKFNWFNKKKSVTINSSHYDAQTGYYKIPCEVAAAEMMYPITAKVYVNGSATPLEGDRYTKQYRVRDYADVILDSNSDFSKELYEKNAYQYHRLVELTKAMLDYGAKAQNVFDRHKDIDNTDIDLANSDVAYTMASKTIEVSAPPDMNATKDGGTLKDKYGLEFRGATLVLNTTTDIRLYYSVRDKSKYESGKTSLSGLEQNVDFLCYDIKNIAANDLDKAKTATLGTETYGISVLQVARAMQGYYEEGSDEHNLATSLYWYNYYAKAYFNYEGA